MQKIEIPEKLKNMIQQVSSEEGQRINEIARARDRRIADLLAYFIETLALKEGVTAELSQDLTSVIVHDDEQ